MQLGAALTLFITSLIFVGLRSFQQLNVQWDRFMWVPPTSACMAVVEVLTVTTIVKAGSLWAAIPMGMGAAIGCILSMLIHRRMRRGK